jgi:hypothetical protein
MGWNPVDSISFYPTTKETVEKELTVDALLNEGHQIH